MSNPESARETILLKTFTLFCAGALALPFVSQAQEKLPPFIDKVGLLNCGGAEPTPDGTGVALFRLPAALRDKLSEGAQKNYRMPAHSEIRFVLNEGANPEDVAIQIEVLPESGHLGPGESVGVEFFGGDYQYFLHGKRLRSGKVESVSFPTHGAFAARWDHLPHTRYSPRLCRMVFHGSPIIVRGISGDIRPPRPDELPPVMSAYGTSITQGHNATRTDLTWAALSARALGYDLVNLGTGGSAYCEPEIADYMAKQPWKLCVLELSVNMVKDFTVEQFRERAGYFVNTLAASHPDATVVAISLFPYFQDFTPDGKGNPKVTAYRETLESICRESPHKNVRFIAGPSLLSPEGLCQDMIHPSDHGMIEIASKLAAQLGPGTAGENDGAQ